MEAGGWGDGTTDNSDPKVFVNIVIFDRNYRFLDVAYAQLTASGALMSANYTVKEAGYAYLYVSNENPTLIDVYFDDVTMSYTPSNIVQSNEYYAHGLPTNNSWTRDNAVANNFLANGGTELNATTQVYDLDYRNYDPILGRLNQVDPLADKYSSHSSYLFSFNNPIFFSDPSGADPMWGLYTREEYENALMGRDQAWAHGGSVDTSPEGAAQAVQIRGYNVTTYYSQETKYYTNGYYDYSEYKFSSETEFIATTSGRINYNYSINYDYDLPVIPSRRPDLGYTYLDKENSTYVKNASGGYDLNIAISINLNPALLPGSGFTMDNPGIENEVLAHEMVHGLQLQEAFERYSILDLMNSGVEGDRQATLFQSLLTTADDSVYRLGDARETDANNRSPLFLQSGDTVQYNKGYPIIWFSTR